jgi:hypothetical protein
MTICDLTPPAVERREKEIKAGSEKGQDMVIEVATGDHQVGLSSKGATVTGEWIQIRSWCDKPCHSGSLM